MFKFKQYFKIQRKFLRNIISLTIVLIAVIIGIFRYAGKSQAAWFNDSWRYRLRLTIDHTKVGADLTDFPVYVDLSQLPAQFHQHVNQTDARDIRVTKGDGSTELPREVVYYNATTNTGELHFKYTGTLSSSTDTGIYIYYGNTGASDYAVTDTYGTQNVWDSNYKAVWHFNETSGQHLDSTSNNNDSSSISVTTQGSAVGKIGGADQFVEGNTDYIDLGAASPINLTEPITIDAWTYYTTGSNAYSAIISNKSGAAADTGYEFLYEHSVNKMNIWDSNNGLSSGVYTDNAWQHTSVACNGGTCNHYRNGTSAGSAAQTINTRTSPQTYIGAYTATTENWNGILDEIRVSDTNRASTWLSTQYNNQNSPSTFFTTGAAEEQKGRAVLNFAFDEGYATTAHDSSPNGYIGTLSGATTPSWQPEDLCMSGKCLYYNGTTAYTSVTTSVPNVQSVSFWVKPKTNGETLIDFDGGTHYITASSGTITASGFSSPTVYVNGQSGGLLVANAWQHVEVTTSTAFTASNITIGKKTAFLNGYIDEFKVYDYARTAAQVKLDFNSRNSQSGVAARFGPDLGNTLSNGLVGYWKMDEASWTNDCATDTAMDSSGNGNNGDSCPATLGPTGGAAGKFGNGGSFDNTDDYIRLSGSTTWDSINNVTVSVWFKANTLTTTSYIFNKYENSTEGWGLRMLSSGWLAIYDDIDDAGSGCGTQLSLDTWYNATVEMIDNGNSTYTNKLYINGVDQNCNRISTGNWASFAGTLYIGNRNAGTTSTFYGNIDDVRVYNRALSPAEVGQLYNWAPGPVGWWKMDENTGTTFTNDSSGNNLQMTYNGSMTTEDWKPGKFGSALEMDGVDDVLSKTDNDILEPNGDIAFMGWVNLSQIDTGDILIYKDNFVLNFDSSDRIGCTWQNTTPTDYFGGGITPISLNTWHHVACVKSGSTFVVYLDGKNDTSYSDTMTGTINNNATSLRLGAYYTGGSSGNINGLIDDIKIYAYARTPAQIIEDMNAGHPAPGSPVGSAVAYWKFNEGYGTTASDNSINANNLTLSTASWTNSGKFGKAFNGLTNVRASRTTDSDLEFRATDDFTLSLWYKSDSASNPGATEYLINDGAAAGSAGYAIYANTSGNLCFGIDDDVTWGPDVASCTTTDVYDNTWHHITAVRNVTSDTTKIYIDAVEKDSDTDSTTATLDSSPTFYIGDANATDGTDEFLGDIDEVKIFRSALTADAIKVLYNQNAAQSLGALSTDSTGVASNADINSYCPPGQGSTCTPPIGIWKLDENTGTNVNDSSGNGYTLSMSGLTASDWVPGKYGSALTYDGTNDWLACTDANCGDAVAEPNLDFGIAESLSWGAWVKTSVTGTVKLIVGKKEQVEAGFAGYSASITTANFVSCRISDGITQVESLSTVTVTDDKWHFVFCTSDGLMLRNYVDGILVDSDSLTAVTGTLNNTVNFRSGVTGTGGSDMNGVVDNIYIYNYVRTPAQIAWDYNRGGPVGWWKMDETSWTNNCSTDTVFDSSGKNNHGDACPASTGPTGGATGKFNNAGYFDGSNDIIQAPDSTSLRFSNALTISAWIKRANTVGAWRIIASKGQASGVEFVLGIDANHKLNFKHSESGSLNVSSTAINDTNWHLVQVVYDSPTVSYYIDGKKDANTYSYSDITPSNGLFYIGYPSPYWNCCQWYGNMDDVRVYNYALTKQQIDMIMNQGAAVRFGP